MKTRKLHVVPAVHESIQYWNGHIARKNVEHSQNEELIDESKQFGYTLYYGCDHYLYLFSNDQHLDKLEFEADHPLYFFKMLEILKAKGDVILVDVSFGSIQVEKGPVN